MTDQPISRIGVVGLGVMGASLARTCTEAGYEVWGCDLIACHSEHCLARGWIARIADRMDDLAGCDLVVIAVSPGSVALVLEHLALRVGSRSVITDVAGVKRAVVEACPPSLVPRYVPGHPMAGSEGSGPMGSEVVRYEGAPWVLTPGPSVDPECVHPVTGWVESLGSVPVLMSPAEHDRHVALLSHLPHVLASSLLSLAHELVRPDVAGGSWRDLTRVGRSNPELWAQILMANADEVSESISKLKRMLDEFGGALDRRDADQLARLLRAERAEP